MARAEGGPGYDGAARRVKDLPSRSRPREMFDRFGPESVPESVLLALLLRSGAKGVNVVDLADGLLEEYGSLTALAQVSVDELARWKGIGRVKAQIIRAALELARRLSEEKSPARDMIRSPADAARVLRQHARVREQEAFWVLLLDTKCRLKRPPIEVTKGLMDASLVHPREVFKEAIRSSSAAVVVVHNHPSGDPTPSAEDIHISKQLVQAGHVVDIKVLDHVILGLGADEREADHISLRESGLVDFEKGL